MAAAVPHIALQGLDSLTHQGSQERKKWHLAADGKASDICGGCWGATADHTDTIWPAQANWIAQRYTASGYVRQRGGGLNCRLSHIVGS
ncbi:hypothetical protein NDU88_006172 [Pleurodeles waltl]|uniref:Uncharacterized protein n=1 Tax=Pleurodeles waltl TaxID=8319 RepID=A0AAV7VM34_PLEWA|nr:hypothetical protein NDU88_006172 [Pleurodeles waltl]